MKKESVAWRRGAVCIVLGLGACRSEMTIADAPPAQEPAPVVSEGVSDQAPDPGATLRVLVFDRATGKTLDSVVRLTSSPATGSPQVRRYRTTGGVASLTGLESGAFRLEASSDDHFEASVEVALLRGESREVRFDLEPSRVLRLAFDPDDRIAAELCRSIEYTDASGQRRVAHRSRNRIWSNLRPEGCVVGFEPLPTTGVVVHVGEIDLGPDARTILGMIEVPKLDASVITSIAVTRFPSPELAQTARLSLARDDPANSVPLVTRLSSDGTEVLAEFPALAGHGLLNVQMSGGEIDSYVFPLSIAVGRRDLRVEMP